MHQGGGRVLLDLEPFIIYKYSGISESSGLAWGGKDPLGNYYAQYPDNFSMVAPFTRWQDYVVQVAQRLVGQYGADGIFLDSWGWQMNWPMLAPAENIRYTPLQYSQGVLALADRVRAAIRALPGHADAVVISETASGPLGKHLDGGLDADLGFNSSLNLGRITASPARYGVPGLDYISNGTDLNQLEQIFAAGHNLALCCDWPGSYLYDARDLIHTLVGIRQTYKDALIYGQQAYQPSTGSDAVAAYVYQGATDEIITAVNISPDVDYAGSLALRAGESNTSWADLLNEGTFATMSGSQLPLTVPKAGLRVLLRQGPLPATPTPTPTPGVSAPGPQQQLPLIVR